MALRPDIETIHDFIPQVVPDAETPEPVVHHLIFDATDSRLSEMSREDRVVWYYARELAAGNTVGLTPRYRSSDHDADNPWADMLAADPLSDPRVTELASQLKMAGFEPPLED